MNERNKSDSYYPLRWKIADAIEDLFLLHRATAVGVLALLGLAAIIAGFLLLDRGDTTSTATQAPTSANDAVARCNKNRSSMASAIFQRSG